MKECPKCKKNHDKNGKFCSRSCANSRTWTDDDKFKKSESAKKSEKVILSNQNKSKEIYFKIAETKKKKHKEKILNSEYSELSFESLRFRILYEQDCKCNRCGLNEWLGVNIPLELEHKDGNHHNNQRENLELLCPNCHALTHTWRGRNKTKTRLTISDEVLFNALMVNNWNMRQALIDVGLSAKGGNYKRCHKLKREFEDTLTN
jgi:hypothetical protein